MSFSLNEVFRGTGTKFRVFVQSPVLEGFGDPETIWVSSPTGSLQPGPSDGRMYALLPLKKDPYGADSLPPFRGRCGQPVMPDIDGHFDHVAVDDPGFKCTNMFGTVRRVLDVWETYLGGPINWHFASTHSRLELIPHVPWNNAHFGWWAGQGRSGCRTAVLAEFRCAGARDRARHPVLAGRNARGRPSDHRLPRLP